MGITDSHGTRFLPLDGTSGNRKSIDSAHEVIHAGTHFTISYPKFVNTVGSVSSVVITTPTDGKYVHFVCGIESDKACKWELYKGSSVSGGSTLTSYNNNLNSSNTAGTVIVANPTFTTYGTVLETHYIGTSTTPVSVTGGGVEIRNEWLLYPGSCYTVLITTIAASANTAINMPYYYRT